MRRLSYLRSAQRDIAIIQRFIARESGYPLTARAFVASLQDRCRKLAELPGTLGQARPELGPDIRSIVHKGYLIFFRYRQDVLQIINIIEGHRDVQALFGEEASPLS
ncbi:type II toxin-antitoxin system RelE/ParE family toxin [Sandaracinobacteroides saxicola]|uniref:Type II toxin-antitoxin system RelE/ParE family toxin n=1 Tax=Sandaracinobacteroides saxicola TaxID=2759707 RepID=A0A7G5IJH3_9SPHN|nr:type II toxin-antitoxin system RelE/ParE family toxin [Sandaracinobacteroides saxicola]QMW23515.1 type II toxin-antitoxin system RelE/ParE family toxin [Sandaracinobacteroides saxicola]